VKHEKETISMKVRNRRELTVPWLFAFTLAILQISSGLKSASSSSCTISYKIWSQGNEEGRARVALNIAKKKRKV
tara:strand:- start:1560 stop:1784 length:225 start_codon:yes stop_codon:yes gene_type:complete